MINRGEAGEKIVDSVEENGIQKRNNVLFLMAEIPDVETCEACTENMDCLGGENSVNQEANDDFLARLPLNFLKFSNDVNNRLKTSDNEAVQNHAAEEGAQNLLFLRNQAQKKHLHGFFDEAVEQNCGNHHRGEGVCCENRQAEDIKLNQ